MKTVFTKTKNFKAKETHVEKQKIPQNPEKNTKKAIPNSAIKSEEVDDNIKKLSKLFDVIDAGIFVINNNGDFLEVNHACCTIYGYNKEELIGKNIKIFSVKNEAAQKIKSVFKYANATPLIIDWQSICKDGHKINITTSSTTCLNNDGTAYCVTTIKNIITPKNEQENAELKIENYALLNDDNIAIFQEDAISIIKNSDDDNILKAINLLKLAEKITHMGIIEVYYL